MQRRNKDLGPKRWAQLMLPLSLGVIATCGCERPPLPAQGATATPPPVNFQPDAPVGVAVKVSTDTQLLPKLIALKSFSKRSDPFQLFPIERQFENSQRSESLWQSGNFGMQYEPPEDVIEEETYEEQPYRRLSGILVGETIQAIMIWDDRQTYIIRPGSTLPGGWTVVAIDLDKATLRRSGNRKPNQIYVRLEQDLSSAFGGAVGGGGGAVSPGGGRPGGGRPMPGGGGPQMPGAPPNPGGGRRGGVGE